MLAPLFAPLARLLTGGSTAAKTPGGGYALPQSQRDRMHRYARYGRRSGGIVDGGSSGHGRRRGFAGKEASGFTTIDEMGEMFVEALGGEKEREAGLVSRCETTRGDGEAAREATPPPLTGITVTRSLEVSAKKAGV